MTMDLVTATDALAVDLVPVPSDAPDVCPMCRSWRPSGSDCCNNCEQAFRDLSVPCPTVVPICLYSKPSPMRDRMTFYKDPEKSEHARYPNEVAAILDRYFFEHGEALVDYIGGWDTACLVPSVTRLPPHPLELALTGLPASYVPERGALLERHTGELGHRKLSDDAYRLMTDVSGQRILILDDVYGSAFPKCRLGTRAWRGHGSRRRRYRPPRQPILHVGRPGPLGPTSSASLFVRLATVVASGRTPTVTSLQPSCASRPSAQSKGSISSAKDGYSSGSMAR